MNLEAKALMSFGESIKKGLVLGSMMKDPLPPLATIHDMVIRILIVDPKRASHKQLYGN